MIQPSALPAAGATLLAPDASAALPGETTGETAKTTQFADFLAKNLGFGPATPGTDTPAPATPPTPANPVATLRAALNRALGAVNHPVNGKDTGKPGGKNLPELPETGATPKFDQSEDQVPDDATAALATATDAVPGAAAPVEASPAVQTAQSAPAAFTPEGQAIAALVTASPQVQPAPVSGNATALARPSPFTAEPDLLPVSPAALQFREPEAQPLLAQTAPVLPDSVFADRLTRPAIALRKLAQLSEALAKAKPATAPLAPLTSATSAALASPAFQPEAAPAGLPPGQRVPAKLAFDGRLAELNPANRASEAEISDAAAASPETAARPAGKAPSPETAILLPAALPVTPWSAAEPQQSLASAPGTAAPATQTAPQPRDFAGLIDRLVEAREAAQASLAPQSVQAALAHADFGKVSLQFQHDVGGMTVAMTSTDPDFSRAVQAAAPGAQTSSDSANPQRQDTFGQSSAGAGFAQSQSQQRGQSPARDGVDPRPAANPSPSRRNGNDSSTRGGIFA